MIIEATLKGGQYCCTALDTMSRHIFTLLALVRHHFPAVHMLSVYRSNAQANCRLLAGVCGQLSPRLIWTLLRSSKVATEANVVLEWACRTGGMCQSKGITRAHASGAAERSSLTGPPSNKANSSRPLTICLNTCLTQGTMTLLLCCCSFQPSCSMSAIFSQACCGVDSKNLY